MFVVFVQSLPFKTNGSKDRKILISLCDRCGVCVCLSVYLCVCLFVCVYVSTCITEVGAILVVVFFSHGHQHRTDRLE